MTKYWLILPLLLVPITASAFDVMQHLDPVVAAQQPCMSVADAVNAIKASQGTCPKPTLPVWINICAGEILDKARGIMAITYQNALIPDTACSPKATPTATPAVVAGPLTKKKAKR